MSPSARLLLGSSLALALGSCASFAPAPLASVPFAERSQTQRAGDLTVRSAVPTRKEATAIYGVDLGSKGIQPVWLEVVNESERPYWFLAPGLDPHAYAPTEASFAFHRGAGPGADAIDEHFESLQFQNPARPGATTSGFVLVNLDEGYKVVDVDLIARDDAANFTFVFVDPEFRADFKQVDVDGLWSDDQLVELTDEDALRAALAELPQCTTNKKGGAEGDPLNLVMVGERSAIFAAMVRRGWHATETIHTDSLWRTAKSFLFGSRYRYSPISPLYVYGRAQDFSAQKARGTINERNHMRFWRTPLSYFGKEVWVGQISRDIGVKFTFKSPTISTHVIDPDVDEARRYLTEDLAYSQALEAIGFAAGVGPLSPEAPRFNLVGDPYYTDGRRAVMFFGERPHALDEIELLDWNPAGGRADAQVTE